MYSVRVMKEHLHKVMAGKLDSRRHKLFLDPRNVLFVFSTKLLISNSIMEREDA